MQLNRTPIKGTPVKDERVSAIFTYDNRIVLRETLHTVVDIYTQETRRIFGYPGHPALQGVPYETLAVEAGKKWGFALEPVANRSHIRSDKITVVEKALDGDVIRRNVTHHYILCNVIGFEHHSEPFHKVEFRKPYGNVACVDMLEYNDPLDGVRLLGLFTDEDIKHNPMVMDEVETMTRFLEIYHQIGSGSS